VNRKQRRAFWRSRNRGRGGDEKVNYYEKKRKLEKEGKILRKADIKLLGPKERAENYVTSAPKKVRKKRAESSPSWVVASFCLKVGPVA